MRRVPLWYFCAGLLLITVVAYAPLWRNGFVDIDDQHYITRNPEVTRGLSWDGFCWAWTNLRGIYWQPLTWLSLQVDAQLFSDTSAGGAIVLNAAGFHAQSLLWHSASVLVLFGLWRRLTGNQWASLFVAALFAVHPLHVESVAWIAERKDVLSLFFGLVTIWAYVRYVEQPRVKRYALMLAVFAVSLLAKPMTMTLPCVLVLLDYWPLRRLWPGSTAEAGQSNAMAAAQPAGKLILEKLPLFAVAAGFAVITLIARNLEGGIVSFKHLPLGPRVANALGGYGQYLTATFWPSGLTVLHPHPGARWSLMPVIGGAAALVLITLVALWQRRRQPWLIVGWLWFIGALFPVIGLAQGGDQAWADRFTYWPHIGLFVAVVFGLADIAAGLHVPAWVRATSAGAACVCLAAATWVQTTYWRNSEVLWLRALAVSQNNHKAHFHLGECYYERGRPDLAEPELTRAVQILDNNPLYHHTLGLTLLSLNKLDDAVAHLREALERMPNDVGAIHNLGAAELRRGNYDEAIKCFSLVLKNNPQSPEALMALGTAYLKQGRRTPALQCFRASLRKTARDAAAFSGMGMVLLGEGEPDRAGECFAAALRMNSGLLTAHNGKGIALARSGLWTQAVESQRVAVELAGREEQRLVSLGGVPLQRDVAALHCDLAYALNGAGAAKAAAEEYRAAAKHYRNWPRDLTSRAWMLATHPDRDVRDQQRAYELASQAVQGGNESPVQALDTQAAALAALGKFQDAVKTARRAMTLASTTKQDALAASIQGRLALYENGKPFLSEQAERPALTPTQYSGNGPGVRR